MSPEPAVREEAAAFPVAFPDAETTRIEEWADRLLAAVGHDAGFAHIEFVLTANGPELVEINRRIGGALVGEALCRRLATNVYDALIDTTLGRRPVLLDTPLDTGPATGFVLVHPTHDGTLTGWTGLDTLQPSREPLSGTPPCSPGDPVHHLHGPARLHRHRPRRGRHRRTCPAPRPQRRRQRAPGRAVLSIHETAIRWCGRVGCEPGATD
ncbi:hypothetical protein RM590_28160 [Streptomyces sp. DSM 44938]|uniref:ATP-grasp domain-containing protein n=1 Tax=Streptomyces litchfieldiae TaxID=3075543 RepID=A0ABU2MXN7_9ACTN|nr:hypothetical protein [Streptomyces sp. DSM 44938]MDT0346428.1 hypothetical protein [Streptomyces sp. DSM 44938]